MTTRATRLAARIAVVSVALVMAGGCGDKKDVQGLPEVTATAMFEKGMDLLNRHQLRQAISMLKRVEFTPEMRDEIEPLLRLALADATFYQGTALALIDARNLYLEFVTLNGDHPLAPYAQLQVGQCSLGQVNHPTKDQTETFQAIRELSAVERRWPESDYIQASRGLLRGANSNLAESEYLVGRFYLRRKAYVAAVERFDRVVEYFPDFPEMEKVLFHLGQAHLRSGNHAEARIHLDRLVTDYPDGEYVKAARGMLDDAGGAL